MEPDLREPKVATPKPRAEHSSTMETLPHTTIGRTLLKVELLQAQEEALRKAAISSAVVGPVEANEPAAFGVEEEFPTTEAPSGPPSSGTFESKTFSKKDPEADIAKERYLGISCHGRTSIGCLPGGPRHGNCCTFGRRWIACVNVKDQAIGVPPSSKGTFPSGTDPQGHAVAPIVREYGVLCRSETTLVANVP